MHNPPIDFSSFLFILFIALFGKVFKLKYCWCLMNVFFLFYKEEKSSREKKTQGKCLLSFMVDLESGLSVCCMA